MISESALHVTVKEMFFVRVLKTNTHEVNHLRPIDCLKNSNIASQKHVQILFRQQSHLAILRKNSGNISLLHGLFVPPTNFPNSSAF